MTTTQRLRELLAKATPVTIETLANLHHFMNNTSSPFMKRVGQNIIANLCLVIRYFTKIHIRYASFNYGRKRTFVIRPLVYAGARWKGEYFTIRQWLKKFNGDAHISSFVKVVPDIVICINYNAICDVSLRAKVMP